MTLRFGILAVGDELVCGDNVDTNSAWLARLCVAHGHRVLGFAVERDDPGAISRAVERFRGVADVLLVTGGLGPTLDDVTRDGVAVALGRRLVLDEEVLEGLRRSDGRPLDEGSERQAWFPRGARILPNPQGTAPGFVLRYGILSGERGGFTVACMPGVPTEMKAMATRLFEEVLSDGTVAETLRVRACGLPESEVGRRLADLMERDDEHVDVGITVSAAVLTVSIRGDDPERMGETERQVRERLGEAVFGSGTTTLAETVVTMLRERGMTLSIAESCTGGLVAAALTSVPGSSDVFGDGVVTYANQAKAERLGVPDDLLREHGAVSPEVAKAMARGSMKVSRSQIAVSITGVAGPGGGSPEKPVGLVVFGVADELGVHTQEHRWRGTRQEIRSRSVSWALDLVRRRLLGLL